MAYQNQEPDPIINSAAYYNGSFVNEANRRAPSDVKSEVVDQSNFQFDVYRLPTAEEGRQLVTELDNEGSDVTTDNLPRLQILSQNVTQVAINQLLPKLEPVTVPLGSYADLNMQTVDFDGFEFSVKYAMKANQLDEFLATTEPFTNKRNTTPYKERLSPNLICFLTYYGLDPFNGLNRGVNSSIAFNQVFILDVSISNFDYENNDLAEVIITYSANRIG